MGRFLLYTVEKKLDQTTELTPFKLTPILGLHVTSSFSKI